MSSNATTPAQLDPRYPIGRFERPAAISAGDRTAAMATLAGLPAQLRATVSGWSDAQLDTPYRDGGWTVRQLVHHMADSHSQAATRLRKALTEDGPTIQPYNEKSWADLPDETRLPIEPSLAMLDGLHTRWSYLLQQLDEAQWQRTLQHPESGAWTVDALTQLYAWHSRHHLAHIVTLKSASGW